MEQSSPTPFLGCDIKTGETKITLSTLNGEPVTLDPRQDILFISLPKKSDAEMGATLEVHWNTENHPKRHHPDYKCVSESVLIKDNREQVIGLIRDAVPGNPIAWMPIAADQYYDRLATLMRPNFAA